MKITVVGEKEELPMGCAVYPVTATMTAYVDVASHGLDASELLAKTRVKLGKTADSVEKLRKAMAVEGWADKVSDAVREAEGEKLAEAEAQMSSLKESIAQFELMKI